MNHYKEPYIPTITDRNVTRGLITAQLSPGFRSAVRTELPASLALSVEPVTRQVGKGKVEFRGVCQMMGLIVFQVVLPRN